MATNTPLPSPRSLYILIYLATANNPRLVNRRHSLKAQPQLADYIRHPGIMTVLSDSFCASRGSVRQYCALILATALKYQASTLSKLSATDHVAPGTPQPSTISTADFVLLRLVNRLV